MSENKNDMSFADKIARVNRHNMQAVADAHNNLLKRVEVLEQENKEQWDFIMALSDDVARLLNKNEQSEESEQKTEFVQIGGQKLRISPYKAESETVSWKDFEDFLDDNAEDFDSIGERFDALEERLKAIEEKIEGYVFE